MQALMQKAQKGHSAKRAAQGLLIAIACVGMVQCAKERGGEPVDAKTRVYVTIRANPGYVLVFDTQLDSLIDTMFLPVQTQYARVACDPEVPKLVVLNSPALYFYHAGEREPYVELPLQSDQAGLDSRHQLLIVTEGINGGVIAPQVTLYDSESLEPVSTDSVAITDHIEFDRASGLIYGISNYQLTPGAPVYRNELCAYDYLNRTLHRCWNILPDSTGRGYRISSFTLHPDGRRAYLVGSRNDDYAVRIVGYDLNEDTPLFEEPMASPFGEPAVTPDGMRVWIPEVNGGSAAPGEIMVRDAQSGALLKVIELDAYRIHPAVPIAPQFIRFTPDGVKAYVACIRGAGPVFAINATTHDVLKVWYTDTTTAAARRPPQTMDIGPVP